MGKTRTFLGIDTGPGIRKSASELQRQLSRACAEINWTNPESLHLTLLFLGDLDDRELVSVCRIVTDIASGAPPFALRIRGVGAFPNPRRPKIVWAGVAEGAPVLCSLYQQLEARVMDAVGYRPEEREYTPHLTLGRVKPQADTAALATVLGTLTDWDGGEVSVRELCVYRSELRRQGPEYTVIGRGAFQE